MKRLTVLRVIFNGVGIALNLAKMGAAAALPEKAAR